MRVVELRDGFGLDRLRIAERPEPRPGPGRIVVRMRAAALNYRDFLMVEGRYDPRQPLPLVPCSDGAGEVEAVGDGVTRVAPGDRVIPIFAQRWIAGAPTRDRLRSTLGGPLDGTLAELVELDAEGVVAAPPHLGDEEAATLPCAGLTAWNALQAGTPVAAGETVLVLGTGGVATFALQFAAFAGARVVVTSSRDDKLARARELGAWETVNYRDVPQWGRRVRELTGGEGVDRVIEIGGTDTLPQSLAAVGFGGQVVVVGNVTGGTLELNIVPVFMRQLRIQGMLVGHRDSLERMCRAVSAAELRPVIDRTFPLDEHRAAFERLASGDHVGKVCVRV